MPRPAASLVLRRATSTALRLGLLLVVAAAPARPWADDEVRPAPAAAAGGADRSQPDGGALCAPGPVLLLDGFGTPGEELARLAELSGLAPLEVGMLDRAGARERRLCAGAEALAWMGHAAVAPGGDGLSVLPARVTSLWNAAYPTGGNDGLLWAGRGVSAMATVGLAWRHGVLSAALAPEVAWQQNRWFETVPTGASGDGAFGSPWYPGQLDLPQRFGAGPFTTASLGRSFARVDAFGAAAGLSTEGLWWGAGRRGALLLAGAGPGFPHAFLGTSRPVDVGIGTLEAKAIWGRLDRTRHVEGPRHAWLTGLALAYAPRWVPGLSLGVGRLYIQSWESLRRDHFLTVFEPPLKRQVTGGDNPDDNQLAAGWVRWVMPAAGFSLYGEWGRDDFPVSLEGLVREPEPASGWIAGFEKLLAAGPRTVRIQAELSLLHHRPALGAGPQPFYVHGGGLDATHRGQLLGAAVGPGGDSQFLSVDLLGPGGRLGGWLERARRNDDVFWAVIAPAGRASERDAELTIGVRQLLFAGPVEIAWHAAAAFRWNRDFLGNEPNLQLGLSLAVPLAGRSGP